MDVGKKLKEVVKKYDDWCSSVGLSQEQGRCCVPVRKEDYSPDTKNKQTETQEDKDNDAV